MKPKSTLTLVGVFLATVLILSGCSTQVSNTELPTQVQTIPVASQELSYTIQGTGTVEGENQTTLASKVSGRVAVVHHQVGDQVAAGDLLVELEGGEWAIQAQGAEQNYRNAIASHQTTQQFLIAEVDRAASRIETLKVQKTTQETSLKNAEVTSQKNVELAKKQVELAEIAVSAVQNTTRTKQTQIDVQKERLVAQANILTQATLNHIYFVLSTSEGTLNYTRKFDRPLGQKNQQLQQQMVTQTLAMQRQATELKDYYDQFIDGKSPSNTTLQTGFEMANATLSQLENTLETLYDLLINSVAHDQLPDATLLQFQQSTAEYGTKLEALRLSVSNGSVIGLEGVSQGELDLNVQTSNEASKAATQLQIAQEGYTLAQRNRQSQLDDLRGQISLTERMIDEAIAQKNAAQAQLNLQSQLLKTQVDQAKSQRDLTATQWHNTQVKAPFSGVVISMQAEPGQVIQAGVPLVEFASASQRKVVAQLSKADAEFVQVGQSVLLTTDETEEPIEAVVQQKGQHADAVTQKVPIEMVPVENESNLIIGDFIRFEMKESSSVEGVVVPSSALIYQGDIPVVATVAEGKIHFQSVETGRTIGDQIEIRSGLSEGDRLIIKGHTYLKEGQLVDEQ